MGVSYRRPAEDVERILICLAECNGNTALASRQLAEGNVEIKARTLLNWKKATYAERYERIRAEVMPKVRQQAAESHLAMARQLMETEDLIRIRLHEEVPELPPRDLPAALRNVSTSAAIHVDKAVDKLGNAQPEVGRLSVEEALRKLKVRGIVAFEAEVSG